MSPVHKRLILWFRRDLRVHDHEALTQACRDAEEIIPVFVLDPEQLNNPEISSGRVQFMLEALTDLDASLRARGSTLFVLRGQATEMLPKFVEQTGAQGVYFSADIERWSGQLRDRALCSAFASAGRIFKAHLNYFVQTDGVYEREVWTQAWTAFSKLTRAPAPQQIKTPALDLNSLRVPFYSTVPALADLGLPPHGQTLLPGGESAARKRLPAFLSGIERYRGSISKPALGEAGGTSRLSAYIKFGCVSVRECVQRARERYRTASPTAQKGLEAWASRMRWRDYFIQKFAVFPQAEFVNIYAPFDAIRQPDQINVAHLDAWQQGRTGYPMIDAAMRALTQTGLLNFRMRAMLATFLSVNLMMAWQHGALWFMRHLLDGDACIDHWQWQMQAGITQPTRRFVRAYNPVKQALDHDADAGFIRKYVPELARLPASLMLQPHTLTPMEQQLYGVQLGRDYPWPIVDADASRKTALTLIQPIRERLAASEDLAAHISHVAGITPAVTMEKPAP
jgi:deoxyribodipyrimidine photo-lyase